MPTRRAQESQVTETTADKTLVHDLATSMNLGPKSAAVLLRAGVPSLAEVRKLGSVRAYSLAKRVEPSVTLNLLWALEGAVLGQPWQQVAKEHRTSLLIALEDHETHFAKR